MDNRYDNISDIVSKINDGEFETAAELLKNRDMAAVEKDILAVLEATICQGMQNEREMYSAISRGLEVNGRNYELYVLLADYYLNRNFQQAYLCYENALFYCDNEEDKSIIRSYMAEIEESGAILPSKTAIVILSYNLLDMTRDCIESIRKTVPESAREIIVVDNASSDGSAAWLREQKDIKLLCNRTNEGFPRGCNQGIEMAEAESDIFLLNNDTVLMDNALFWLRMGLYENNETGSTGSVSNNVVNFQKIETEATDIKGYIEFAKKQNIPMGHAAYEEKIYLVGFALLLKRSVLNEVGCLDEQFSPGNYEDNDIGLRIFMAGYKNVLCRNSFIVHWGSKSFNKESMEYGRILAENKEKFQRKWAELNIDLSYYANVREDIVACMLGYKVFPGMKVLEVGCGCGATLSRLKAEIPDAVLFGMEINPRAVEIAGRFAHAVCVNVENISGDDMAEEFDCIIFGDVLEHLHNPLKSLREMCKMLKKGGYIVASLPNVMHYSVMMPLLQQGAFTYTDAGILDRTHLHLFTKLEAARLVCDAGLTIKKIGLTQVGNTNEEIDAFINKLTEFMDQKDPTQFLAYQYLLIAEKTG